MYYMTVKQSVKLTGGNLSFVKASDDLMTVMKSVADVFRAS